MNIRVKKKVLLFAIIIQLNLLLCACHQPTQTATTALPDSVENNNKKELTYQVKNDAPLNEQAVVEAAEKFIADNGYTDLPPMSDKSQLTPETIEWESDAERTLQFRHDTLERKAFSISKGRQIGKMGWTIGFRYKRGTDVNGRAVTMDVDGGNMRVEHKDVFLKKLDRILLQ